MASSKTLRGPAITCGSTHTRLKRSRSTLKWAMRFQVRAAALCHRHPTHEGICHRHPTHEGCPAALFRRARPPGKEGCAWLLVKRETFVCVVVVGLKKHHALRRRPIPAARS